MNLCCEEHKHKKFLHLFLTNICLFYIAKVVAKKEINEVFYVNK